MYNAQRIWLNEKYCFSCIEFPSVFHTTLSFSLFIYFVSIWSLFSVSYFSLSFFSLHFAYFMHNRQIFYHLFQPLTFGYFIWFCHPLYVVLLLDVCICLSKNKEGGCYFSGIFNIHSIYNFLSTLLGFFFSLFYIFIFMLLVWILLLYTFTSDNEGDISSTNHISYLIHAYLKTFLYLL